jgi:hypothetical protein
MEFLLPTLARCTDRLANAMVRLGRWWRRGHDQMKQCMQYRYISVVMPQIIIRYLD